MLVPVEGMRNPQLVLVAREVAQVHETVLADVARGIGRGQRGARDARPCAPSLHPAQQRRATSAHSIFN